MKANAIQATQQKSRANAIQLEKSDGLALLSPPILQFSPPKRQKQSSSPIQMQEASPPVTEPELGMEDDKVDPNEADMETTGLSDSDSEDEKFELEVDRIDYKTMPPEETAQEAGERHAAIIRNEGHERIRTEIKEKLDSFIDDTDRATYLELVKAAHSEYQQKHSPTGESRNIEEIRKSLKTLKSQRRTIINKEVAGTDREVLISEIKMLRTKIAGLKVANTGLNNTDLKEVKYELYSELGTIVPYYGQGNNANILPKYSEGKNNHAYKRTCNISGLTMTLEGLGKTANDFKGNKKLLQLIASLYTGAFEGKQAPGSAKFKTKVDDLFSWRFPDFMQVVYIYHELIKTPLEQEADAFARKELDLEEGKIQGRKTRRAYNRKKSSYKNDPERRKKLTETFEQKGSSDPEKFKKIVEEAQVKVAPKISKAAVDMFKQIAKYFGASTSTKYNPKGAILTGFGLYNRKQKRDAEKEAPKNRKKEIEAQIHEDASKRAKKILEDQGIDLSSRRGKGKLKSEIRKQRSLIKQEQEQQLTAEAEKRAQQYFEEQGITDPSKRTRNQKISSFRSQIKKERAAKEQQIIKQKEKELWRSKGLATQQGWKETYENPKTSKGKDKTEKQIQEEKTKWEASVAATSEAGMEGMYSIEEYKNWVINEMTKHKSAGHEIIVNLYNHFVRFKGFYKGGIIEQDPGNRSRSNNKVSWSEARKKGYFRKYTIVKP